LSPYSRKSQCNKKKKKKRKIKRTRTKEEKKKKATVALLGGEKYRRVNLPPPSFFCQFLPPPSFFCQFLSPPYFSGLFSLLPILYLPPLLVFILATLEIVFKA